MLKIAFQSTINNSENKTIMKQITEAIQKLIPNETVVYVIGLTVHSQQVMFFLKNIKGDAH